MPYPEEFVAPMRTDLTVAGFNELKTAEAVKNILERKEGTTLLVVNSVCGCAAGQARPGIKGSLENEKTPENLVTVFAGQDTEATQEARKYFFPYPASSPSIALFKDGKLVHFIERQMIEGKSSDMIAENLKTAYNEFC